MKKILGFRNTQEKLENDIFDIETLLKLSIKFKYVMFKHKPLPLWFDRARIWHFDIIPFEIHWIFWFFVTFRLTLLILQFHFLTIFQLIVIFHSFWDVRYRKRKVVYISAQFPRQSAQLSWLTHKLRNINKLFISVFTNSQMLVLEEYYFYILNTFSSTPPWARFWGWRAACEERGGG